VSGLAALTLGSRPFRASGGRQPGRPLVALERGIIDGTRPPKNPAKTCSRAPGVYRPSPGRHRSGRASLSRRTASVCGSSSVLRGPAPQLRRLLHAVRERLDPHVCERTHPPCARAAGSTSHEPHVRGHSRAPAASRSATAALSSAASRATRIRPQGGRRVADRVRHVGREHRSRMASAAALTGRSDPGTTPIDSRLSPWRCRSRVSDRGSHPCRRWAGPPALGERLRSSPTRAPHGGAS
jgi:hypothetical protein